MRLIKPKISYFLAISYCCSFQATANITFFIRQYPTTKQEIISDNERLLEKIKTPGKVSNKTMKNNLLSIKSNEGIFATYFGYLGLSDFNGQITFPRKTQKPSFKLIITPRIKPILMIGNTIHHWELDPTVPTELYLIERKQDPASELWYWQTTKAPLPDDKIIQLDSIVVFTKPKSIFVPEGITMSDNNPQLVLPDIYVKNGLNSTAHALWVLTVRQFFSPTRSMLKKDSNTYFSEYLKVK